MESPKHALTFNMMRFFSFYKNTHFAIHGDLVRFLASPKLRL